MASETKDRKVNTGAAVRNDGAKRLPNERDESPEAQESAPREDMQQAASDLERGLVDTDLHGVRGVERVAPAPPRQARPAGKGKDKARP